MRKINNPYAEPALRDRLNKHFYKLSGTGKLLMILGVTYFRVYAVTDLDRLRNEDGRKLDGKYYLTIQYRKIHPGFWLVAVAGLLAYLGEAVGSFVNDFHSNYVDGGKTKIL